MHKLQSTIDYAFKLCGSIGLFFSFTEVRFYKQRHAIYHIHMYTYIAQETILNIAQNDLFNI